MALAPTYELYALATIPVGFFTLTMITAANTAIQIGTDPAMRGRVMSLYVLVLFGATPVGSPIVGWIAEAWGARWSILSARSVRSSSRSLPLPGPAAAGVWRSRTNGASPAPGVHPPGERAAREQARVDVASDESGDPRRRLATSPLFRTPDVTAVSDCPDVGRVQKSPLFRTPSVVGRRPEQR